MRWLQVTHLEDACRRYAVTELVSEGESIRVDDERLVTSSRSEPDDVHLGSRIPATQSPLDPSAVPIQEHQHRVLVSLSNRQMPRRHLNNGDQQQLLRHIRLVRGCHVSKYFIGDAMRPAAHHLPNTRSAAGACAPTSIVHSRIEPRQPGRSREADTVTLYTVTGRHGLP
jgi:hypothetical protein